MQAINTDSNDFEQICGKKQIYIDKTAFLHRLITDPNGTLFFLSRPRRFGKSLMISTLKAIFQGKRELFDDLAIAKTDYDWKVHPVIHLNMGFCARPDYAQFMPAFASEIRRALSKYHLEYNPANDAATNFGDALDSLAAQGALPVVLVDEYDDPVARTLGKPEDARNIRDALATIYGQLKDRVGNLRFVMITGVSKFTKMSVFSALSSLRDISFDDKYAAMLGFTEAELDTYYSEHIAAHASVMKMTTETYRNELRRLYNGYRFWTYTGDYVYNPVSINMTLADKWPNFKRYWAATGRPSMLMNYLKRETVLAIDPERVSSAAMADFDVTDLEHIPIKGLLYQTGYLTIREYDPMTDSYTLGIPDEEVREDFAMLMTSLCANKPVEWASSLGTKMLHAEWDEFFRGLKSLYAGVAYGPKEARVCEYSYGRCLAFLLQGQGVICQPEVTQADGRVDMICTHPCGIYIFELKVDHPAAIAMSQMECKHYAAPYLADKRPVWLIGLSFASSTRQLMDCIVKQVGN